MQYTSKKDVEKEAYYFFNKFVRDITEVDSGHNNDIDAFRHAYASGIYTMEFGDKIACLLGQFNEIKGALHSQPDAEKNMDLWNNWVGRKYGKKAKSKIELAKLIVKALNNGELIITNDQAQDSRKYKDRNTKIIKPNKPVVVIKESSTGRNEIFLDVVTGMVMTRDDFVKLIQLGEYQGYRIARIHNILTPISKHDGSTENNLG